MEVIFFKDSANKKKRPRRDNSRLPQHRVSDYNGITWNKEKWHARLHLSGGQKLHLGYFIEEKAAAKAYDEAVKKHFEGNEEGQLKRLNYLDGNTRNPQGLKAPTSKFTGVSWMTSVQKWRARICIKGRTRCLGLFDFRDEDAAAVAYDKLLVQHFQEKDPDRVKRSRNFLPDGRDNPLRCKRNLDLGLEGA